ncbi:radical SAM/SPASM domain-containing protein [Vallitalea guaymasensis]|uniref:Radical SAM protein n=1 Tax=Vallitalea guaymasensis TaxID=1185412 RepID=A0A8J8MBL1_9FIRM|nr:radical SAM protein [Vallitalea guaymasensis]QUH29901.1 radical SAM protein [Vallitalea guaymasensis]
MNRENSYKFIEVETDKAIYNFEFSSIHIEITGNCNMSCEHCRGAFDDKIDLPLDQIIKIVKFTRKYSPAFKEITLSGGETFMHKQFKKVLKSVRELNVTHITLMSNGTFIDNDIIDYIKTLKFERVTFSISLDTLSPTKHNSFRHNDKAYEYAISALKRLTEVKESSFQVAIRSTILPDNIEEMEDMTIFAISLGANRVSFSSVFPSGIASEKPELWMDAKTLRKFSDNLNELYHKYGNRIDVSSIEPLKWLSRKRYRKKEDGVIEIDTCPAGTISFNINSNGDMTPCALLNLPMFNILDKTEEEIEKAFINNSIVHNLLDRNLKGNCGDCSEKDRCAGCRARAYYVNGDYLGEDPNCWKHLL